MNTPYLTDEEIARLTHPLTQGAARCRYLEREYGVKVRRTPDGQPIVGREEFEQASLSRPKPKGGRKPDQAPPEPDWDALRNAGKRRFSVVS